MASGDEKPAPAAGAAGNPPPASNGAGSKKNGHAGWERKSGKADTGRNEWKYVALSQSSLVALDRLMPTLLSLTSS